MILVVVADICDPVATYIVTYDSGRVKKFTHKDKLPKSVIEFMRDHEPVKKTFDYWTKYTYIYTNKKGGN